MEQPQPLPFLIPRMLLIRRRDAKLSLGSKADLGFVREGSGGSSFLFLSSVVVFLLLLYDLDLKNEEGAEKRGTTHKSREA